MKSAFLEPIHAIGTAAFKLDLADALSLFANVVAQNISVNFSVYDQNEGTLAASQQSRFFPPKDHSIRFLYLPYP